MGLGGSPSEWDEYEWVRLADLPVDLPAPRAGRRAAATSATSATSGRLPVGRSGARSADQGVQLDGDGDAAGPLAEAICDRLEDLQIWPGTGGTRVLLVDLDNLRAGPMHWRARMAVVTALARQTDHVVLAGQGGAVARARPHLAEFADQAQAVGDGSDVADHVLLNAAERIDGDDLQVLVVSNDGIFAGLADRGSLIVLSPGADALSDRLREAASRTIDLAALEKQFDVPVAAPRAAAQPATRKQAAARKQAGGGKQAGGKQAGGARGAARTVGRQTAGASP